MVLSAEQLELRKTGVTASEIAAIVDLNKNKSAGDVWAEKIGLVQPFSGNEDTERGNELEEALVRWTGRRLRRHTLYNKDVTFRSKTEEIALATPDGFLFEEDIESAGPNKWKATIEVKSPRWTTFNDWKDPQEVPDGCPKKYLVQATWQAGVMGLDHSIVSGLVDGRLLVYQIPFSQALYAALLQRAKDFWGHVLRREPPPISAGQSTAWVKEAYREQLDKDLVEPPTDKIEELLHAAQTYAAAREIAARAKLDMDASKGFLTSAIQAHEGLKLSGWRCTWRQNGPKREVDWEAIATKAMDRLAGVVSVEEMDQWIIENTKTKPGSRTFNLREE